MSAILCSAPGKLFLGGEYAVLDGGEAVVTAVNRRAVAMPARRAYQLSPVMKAVTEHVSRFLRDECGAPQKLATIKVSTPDFQIGRKKIGVGSSAAVSASACGLLFELAGLPIEAHRSRILDIAKAAHRSAQGGRGSGADVAASVLGGTLVFTPSGTAEQVGIGCVEIVAVWSGRTASTTELIGQVDRFFSQDPKAHQACFDELGRLAAQLAEAYRKGDPSGIITGTKRYGESMGRLGLACGAPIVTSEHELVANLASDSGGAAKPSGAGGGDTAVAVFKDSYAAKQFRNQCVRHKLFPLDLSPGESGLHLDKKGDGTERRDHVVKGITEG